MAQTPIVDTFDGPATVASYSVIHGRDGEPEWAALICDLAPPPGHDAPRHRASGGAEVGARCYARLTDPGALRDAESDELIGRPVNLATDANGINTAHL
jgi:acetyl-CoA C-acetyltransferase